MNVEEEYQMKCEAQNKPVIQCPNLPRQVCKNWMASSFMDETPTALMLAILVMDMNSVSRFTSVSLYLLLEMGSAASHKTCLFIGTSQLKMGYNPRLSPKEFKANEEMGRVPLKPSVEKIID